LGPFAELKRCERFIERALSGQGTMILISGEAGIGKTALTAAVGERAQARGAAFAVGSCCESGGMPAFEAWQELFEELRETGAQLDGFAAPFGDAAASRTAYELMLSVARALIAASRHPHWCFAWKTRTGPTGTPLSCCGSCPTTCAALPS
jgi:hypothetical protein